MDRLWAGISKFSTTTYVMIDAQRNVSNTSNHENKIRAAFIVAQDFLRSTTDVNQSHSSRPLHIHRRLRSWRFENPALQANDRFMQAVIFCGIQGSGKSTFFRQRYFDTHVRINMDMLRTRHREGLILGACIDGKTAFVVDNTNPTAADRARYIAPAMDAGFTVIGYYFACNLPEAIRRNASRQGVASIPVAGVAGTYKRLQIPSLAEGFDELWYVRNQPDGTFSVEAWRESPPVTKAEGTTDEIR
ncbi:MAG TPA: hypothetical protein VH370_27325 [Humisphaera sp.]|jgi:predicted kinase|nr:hypothetical protein [Humisphaera sp.]